MKDFLALLSVVPLMIAAFAIFGVAVGVFLVAVRAVLWCFGF